MPPRRARWIGHRHWDALLAYAPPAALFGLRIIVAGFSAAVAAAPRVRQCSAVSCNMRLFIRSQQPLAIASQCADF